MYLKYDEYWGTKLWKTHNFPRSFVDIDMCTAVVHARGKCSIINNEHFGQI